MLREVVSVIRKELRLARRDPRFVGPSLIVPFVFLLVYSILWSSVGGGESFVCGLVVEDQSQAADDMAAIIEGMRSTTNYTWFDITRYSESEASALFANGNLIAYILIPEGFGTNLSLGVESRVVLFLNNLNDDVVKNYIHRVEAAVLLFNQKAYAPNFDQSDSRIALQETLNLDKTPSNIDYTASAAIILSVIVCTLAGQSMLTAGQFETKAIYDEINSPSNRAALIFGRTLAAIPRTLFVLLITYPIITIWFGVTPSGNPFVLFFILLLTIIGLVPLGEIFGILTKNKEQALLVGVILSVVCFFAGGGLAPVGLLPQLFRYFTYIFPSTHGMTMWNRVYFFDTTEGLLFNSIALVVFWFIGTLIAVLLTNKEVESS
jgi:ABC-2 type transport system permease protein